jgi:hypothetical protein
MRRLFRALACAAAVTAVGAVAEAAEKPKSPDALRAQCRKAIQAKYPPGTFSKKNEALRDDMIARCVRNGGVPQD